MTLSNKEKAKKHYRKVINNHKTMLAKTRKLVCFILDDLMEKTQSTNHQNNPEINPDSPRFCPVSDTRTDIIQSLSPENKNLSDLAPIDTKYIADMVVRMGRIIVKIIPLEQQLAKLDLTQMDLDELHELNEHIEQYTMEEELQMIDDYVMDWIRKDTKKWRSLLEGEEFKRYRSSEPQNPDPETSDS